MTSETAHRTATGAERAAHGSRRRGRAAAAGLLLAACLAGPAAARDGDGPPPDVDAPIWHYGEGLRGGEAAAVLGIPETDVRVISLVCRTEAPTALEILPELFVRPDDAEPRMVLFTIDGTGHARAAHFRYDEAVAADRAFLTVNRDDPLIRAMRRGGSMRISFDPPDPETGVLEATLEGSGRAIAGMLEAC